MKNTKRNFTKKKSHSGGRGGEGRGIIMFGVLRPLRRSNILFERSREGQVCCAKSHDCITCNTYARIHVSMCMCAFVFFFSSFRKRERIWKENLKREGATINSCYSLRICFSVNAIMWSANANGLSFRNVSTFLLFSHSLSLSLSLSLILSLFFSHG